MVRELLGREEAGAAPVLVLSRAVAALVLKGEDLPSPGRPVLWVLSSPVLANGPRRERHLGAQV